MKKVLFVCAQNSGRSKMVAAFFNFYAKQKKLDWVAESAGTFPAGKVKPKVIEVMKEIGIDLSKEKPNKFVAEKINEFERVVSFGCLVKSVFSKEVQERIEDWIIDDPHLDRTIEEVREIQKKVEQKVLLLLKEIS